MATTTKKKSSAAGKKTTAVKKTKTAKKTAVKSTSTAKVSANSTQKKVATQVKTKKTPTKKPWDAMKKLNVWNWALAGLHLLQGILIIVLSGDSLQAVTTSYLTTDTIPAMEGGPVLVEATRGLFDVNLAYIVAAFFFMSAIAHVCIATWYRKKYEAGLGKGINKARWIEYGISASTMMIGIAMLSGVSDLSTLLMLFGATLVMNLLGLMMEVHNQTTTKTSWLSFNIGTLSGILPWIVVAIYFWGANVYGEGSIPTFVYWIYGSMFVFFSSFAVNMWLQYRKKGKWADYLYGEKAYMVLSLVAKSVLAWQVFAGTLRP